MSCAQKWLLSIFPQQFVVHECSVCAHFLTPFVMNSLKVFTYINLGEDICYREIKTQNLLTSCSKNTHSVFWTNVQPFVRTACCNKT